MEVDLSTNANILRSRVYNHMLETRGWKYRAFLRHLRLFKYISFSKNRGAFLEYYYTMMRYLDDIVDGDAKLPEGYTDEIHYIQSKIDYSRNIGKPADEVDLIMLHCMDLGKRFGEDFTQETQDILQSLLFDARRKGSYQVFPEQVLMQHFHKMDITGTIKATLKIFKEDPEKYEILEPLGLATRYQFDLEDFESDVASGYLNFTVEECESCGIRPGNYNLDDPGIQRWFKYRASRGLDLIEEHSKRLPIGNFRFLTRLTFPIVYIAPAKRLFKKVLTEPFEMATWSKSSDKR